MDDTKQKIDANSNRVKSLLHMAETGVEILQRLDCNDESKLNELVALHKVLSQFVGVNDYNPSTLDHLI